MEKRPDIPCVIIAGGRSRRFGRPKSFAVLGGQPMIKLIAATLQAQTIGPIAINAPEDERFDVFSCDVIPDKNPVPIGPLDGLRTALSWAQKKGRSTVLTVPVDTPLLPKNLVSRFVQYGAPVIAASRERTHPVCGYWPVSLVSVLEDAIASGVRAAHDWVGICAAGAVTFADEDGYDPFLNINTNDDFECAKKIIEG